MRGALFALLGGLCITMQGIFNARMSDAIGGWHTTSMVHIVAFSIAMTIYIKVRDGKGKSFRQVPFLYLIGGSFGVVVVFSELTAIHMIGPASAIAILLVAQIGTAFLIESRGWFGEKKVGVTLRQGIGLMMMLAGVVLFQL
ncbi:DMT family transporter [Bacillus haikouensis]|jgi:bacterial/archaeal transporter family-2 protein|uniref:DMT family transporter n=1 Tax=Bacillus haikouensis TaxID=1510468 RepID=UPI001551F9D8|nr:DMT family transporter [Bacillus haikouensis]NQD66979.1 DMT family transporter [Bacillus haikouensis]